MKDGELNPAKKIYLSSPHMCGEEIEYIKEAFETKYYKNSLKDQDYIEFMPVADYGTPNHWLTCIILKN